jgi:hypothetical protein
MTCKIREANLQNWAQSRCFCHHLRGLAQVSVDMPHVFPSDLRLARCFRETGVCARTLPLFSAGYEGVVRCDDRPIGSCDTLGSLLDGVGGDFFATALPYFGATYQGQCVFDGSGQAFG